MAWADAVGGSATTLAARILDPAAKVHAAAPAGRVWGLVLLRRSGLAAGASPDRRLAEALEAAAVAARDLGPAAFPAIAHATIARADLHSGHVSDLEGLVATLFWASPPGIGLLRRPAGATSLQIGQRPLAHRPLLGPAALAACGGAAAAPRLGPSIGGSRP